MQFAFELTKTEMKRPVSLESKTLLNKDRNELDVLALSCLLFHSK